MRRPCLGVTLVWLGATLCCSRERWYRGSAEVSATAREQLEACDIPNSDDQALCGTYSVWEDREAKTGRRIALNFVVLPATIPNPEPDPIFFLHGGPGRAATESASSFAHSLLREHRDVVLVDQRGTGKSNPLNCDVPQLPVDQQEAEISLLSSPDFITVCRRVLEKKADLTLYTTPIAMDDLDEVRAALGYEQVNLYGTSYGSRSVQVYLRRHPAHVRTATMVAADPVDGRIIHRFSDNFQRALDLMFQDCDLDTDCHASYPRLRDEFRNVVSSLPDVHRQWTSYETTDTLPLTRREFLWGVVQHLYLLRDASLIPLLIHQAARHDFTLSQQAVRNRVVLYSRLSWGMYLAVQCAEVEPRLGASSSNRSDTYFDFGMAELHARCQGWPKGNLPQGYSEPVHSDVPALLLSGSLDPVTPPSNAEFIARHLSNARHLVFRGAAHTAASRAACRDSIIRKFVDQGRTDSLDVTCAKEGIRPPFALPPGVKSE